MGLWILGLGGEWNCGRSGIQELEFTNKLVLNFVYLHSALLDLAHGRPVPKEGALGSEAPIARESEKAAERAWKQ